MHDEAEAPDWAHVIAERTLQRVRADRERRRALAETARAIAGRLAVRLAEEPSVQRVILFGSLAGEGGLVHERSDIDLAVEGLPVECIDAVGAALEGMAGLPVDLIRTEDASPALMQRIEEDGEILYVAGG